MNSSTLFNSINVCGSWICSRVDTVHREWSNICSWIHPLYLLVLMSVGVGFVATLIYREWSNFRSWIHPIYLIVLMSVWVGFVATLIYRELSNFRSWIHPYLIVVMSVGVDFVATLIHRELSNFRSWTHPLYLIVSMSVGVVATLIQYIGNEVIFVHELSTLFISMYVCGSWLCSHVDISGMK